MTNDVTHIDLQKDIDRLADKLDALTAEFHALRGDVVAATKVHAAKLSYHDKDLVHAFDDIHKLEEATHVAGVKLSAFEERGTKWGEELDRTTERLAEELRTIRNESWSARNSLILAGVSFVGTAALALFNLL